MNQTLLVDALQKPWPHRPMHFNRGPDREAAELIGSGEQRVHAAALSGSLEQKETKGTKEGSRSGELSETTNSRGV